MYRLADAFRPELALSPSTVLTVLIAGACLVGVALGVGPAYGLGALAALAAGLFLYSRPALGGVVLATIVPVTSGIERGVPLPNLRVSEVLIVGVAVLVLGVGDRRMAVRWRPLDWVLFAYVVSSIVLGAANVLRQGQEFTVENVGLIVGPLQFFLLYRAVLTALTSEGQRRLALRLTLLASLPMAVIAMMQQYNLFGIQATIAEITGTGRILFEQTADFARSTGLFGNWLPLAGYFLVVILVALALLLDRSSGVLNRPMVIVVLLAGAAGMVLTVTITTMIAAVVGVVLLGVWYRQTRKLLLWGIAMLLGIFLLFGTILSERFDAQFRDKGTDEVVLVPATVAFRFDLWTEQFFPALDGNWALGFGPELPEDISFRHTESQYLTFLFRGGVPLLLIYGAVLIAAALSAWRLRDSPSPSTGPLARALVVVVLLLVPMGLVFPYFTASGLPQLLFVLLGILASGGAVRTGVTSKIE